MKKLLLLSALLLTFCSCSTESENTQTNQSYLGKWVREFEYQYDSNNQLTQVYNYSEEECYSMSTYEFNVDNEFVKDSYDFVNGDCVRNMLRVYNYYFSGNTLTIYGLETEVFEILESEQNILRLKISYPGIGHKIIEYSKIN